MALSTYVMRLLCVSSIIALSVLVIDGVILTNGVKEKLPYKDSPYMRLVILIGEVAVGVAFSRIFTRCQLG